MRPVTAKGRHFKPVCDLYEQCVVTIMRNKRRFFGCFFRDVQWRRIVRECRGAICLQACPFELSTIS